MMTKHRTMPCTRLVELIDSWTLAVVQSLLERQRQCVGDTIHFLEDLT